MTSSSHPLPPTTRRTRSPRAPRAAAPQSFFQRNRTRFLWGLAAVALVAIGSVVLLNASSPAYACSTEWRPAATAAPAPGATPRLGYVQDDLGREHITIGSTVRYTLCPPTSGKHVNAQGEGPVRAGVYGPDDRATPQGWIHNLEHGGLVLLYRCTDGGDDACGEAGQAVLRDFYATVPNSPICNLPASSTTVVARFDEMAWPYAALLWGQVLPMETFDAQLARDYFAQQGERTNPEGLCARPTPTPAPVSIAEPASS